MATNTFNELIFITNIGLVFLWIKSKINAANAWAITVAQAAPRGPCRGMKK
jgi:hypothetical protein